MNELLWEQIAQKELDISYLKYGMGIISYIMDNWKEEEKEVRVQ